MLLPSKFQIGTKVGVSACLSARECSSPKGRNPETWDCWDQTELGVTHDLLVCSRHP